MAEEPEQSGSCCRVIDLINDGQFEAAKAEFDSVLVGPDLLPFATILSENGAGETEPAAVFGDALARILQNGFCQEEYEVLLLGLRNPGCLDNLQFLIYAEGSEYWRNKIATIVPVTPESAEAQLAELEAWIDSNSTGNTKME